MVLQALLIAALLYEDRRRRSERTSRLWLSSAYESRCHRWPAYGLDRDEIRQPLAAIATFSNAGMNWLKHKTPDIDEVRSVLENIVKVHRADEVIKSVTALFKKESTARKEVDLNGLVHGSDFSGAGDRYEQDCAANEFHRQPAADRYG